MHAQNVTLSFKSSLTPNFFIQIEIFKENMIQLVSLVNISSFEILELEIMK